MSNVKNPRNHINRKECLRQNRPSKRNRQKEGAYHVTIFSPPLTKNSGVPAAFSGTCSKQHLPGYFSRLDELRGKGIQDIYVISVNDSFVMNAWKDSFGSVPVRSCAASFDVCRPGFFRIRKENGQRRLNWIGRAPPFSGINGVSASLQLLTYVF